MGETHALITALLGILAIPATQEPQQTREIVAPGGGELLDFIGTQPKRPLMYPGMNLFQFLETQGPRDLTCLAANHIDVSCPLIDFCDLQFLVLVSGPKLHAVLLHFSQRIPAKITLVVIALSFWFISLGHTVLQGVRTVGKKSAPDTLESF